MNRLNFLTLFVVAACFLQPISSAPKTGSASSKFQRPPPIDCSEQPIKGLEYFNCQPCWHYECPARVGDPPKCNKMCHTPGCYCPNGFRVIQGKCQPHKKCKCNTTDACEKKWGPNALTFIEYVMPTEAQTDAFTTIDVTATPALEEQAVNGPK